MKILSRQVRSTSAAYSFNDLLGAREAEQKLTATNREAVDPVENAKSNIEEKLLRSPLGSVALNRRQFLGRSAQQAASVAATATGLAVATNNVASAISPSVSGNPASNPHTGSTELEPSSAVRSIDRPLRIGIIGLRNQGQLLLKEFANLPQVEIVALCDVDSRQFRPAQGLLTRLERPPAKEIGQWQELVNDPSIDAMIVATPDHWHFAMASAVLTARKDLYLETPVTLRPADARILADLATANGCIVQTGLIHRSSTMYQSAIRAIQSGVLGKIPLVRSWVTHQRPVIGQRAPVSTPAGVDYLSWLGPAPLSQFHPNRFHQNWQWFWDYGNGELGAWGVPLLDVALWGMQLGLPQEIRASGGRLIARDDGETPDTLMVEYNYPQTKLLWEHRSWSPHGLEGRSAATAFYGEKGTLIIDRGGWKIYGTGASQSGEPQPLWNPHLADFVTSIQQRKQPAANLTVAASSTALALLGNVAYRTGETIHLTSEQTLSELPKVDRQLLTQQPLIDR